METRLKVSQADHKSTVSLTRKAQAFAKYLNSKNRKSSTAILAISSAGKLVSKTLELFLVYKC